MAIRLNTLARLSTEHHPTLACGSDPGADTLTQQVSLELGQRCHLGCDQLALRGAQIKLQPGLRHQRHTLSLQVLERLEQVHH